MTHSEFYNKNYKGRKFIVPSKDNNLCYTLGEYEFSIDDTIWIHWVNKETNSKEKVQYLLSAFYGKINSGTWVFSVIDERKKKLKYLKKIMK